MTVSSEVNKSGPYNGNGVTTVFDYDFKIVDEDHLKVIKTSAAGVEATLVIDTHYIVSDVGNPLGGQIALLSAPSTGEMITILRDVPFTQETDLENQGAYYAETVEAAFDLAIMRDQQLAEQIDRAVKIPPSADPEALNSLIEDVIRLSGSADNIDTVAGVAAHIPTVAGVAAHIPTVAGVADEVVIVAGIAPQVVQVAGIASDIPTVADNIADITNFADVYQGPKAADPAVRNDSSPLVAGDLYFNTVAHQLRVYDGGGWQSVTDQSLNLADASYTGDGVETAFVLPRMAATAANVLVWVGGARQVPGTDYTVTADTLTFVTAPGNGLNIDVLVLSTTATMSLPGDGFNLFATKAAAEASAYTVAPETIRLEGHTTPGDLGGGLYKKVGAEPAHGGKFPITLVSSTVVWYEIAEPMIRPQQLGHFPSGDLGAFIAGVVGKFSQVWLSDADWLSTAYPFPRGIEIDGPGTLRILYKGTQIAGGKARDDAARNDGRRRVIEARNHVAHQSEFRQYTTFRRSTAQSIPNNAQTTITPESYDDACGGYKSSVPTRFFVPPGARTIHVYGYVNYTANAAGARQLTLVSQAGAVRTLSVEPASAGGGTTIPFHFVYEAADGDSLYLNTYQTSGGALSVDSFEATYEVMARQPFAYPGERLKIFQGNWDTEEAKYATWDDFVNAVAAYDVLALSHIEPFNDGAGLYAQTPNEPLYNVKGAWAIGVAMLNGTNWHNKTAGPNFGKVYQCQVDHTPASGTMDDEIATYGSGFWIEVPKVKIQDVGYSKLKKLIRDVKRVNPDTQIFGYVSAAIDVPYTDAYGNPHAQLTWYKAGGYANFSFWLNLWLRDPGIEIDGFFLDHYASSFIDTIVRDSVSSLVRLTGKKMMVNITFASAATVLFATECPYLTAGDYLCLEGFWVDNGVSSASGTNDAIAELAKHKNRQLYFAVVAEEAGSWAVNGPVVNGSTNDVNARSLFNGYKRPGWCYSYDRGLGYDHIGTPPI